MTEKSIATFPKSYLNIFSLFLENRMNEVGAVNFQMKRDIQALVSQSRFRDVDNENLRSLIQLSKLLANTDQPFSLQLYPYFRLLVQGGVEQLLPIPNSASVNFNVLGVLSYLDTFIPGVKFSVSYSEANIVVCFEPLVLTILKEEFVELIVGCFLSALSFIYDDALPLDVFFVHQGKFNSQDYEKTWGIDGRVKFSAEINSIVIPKLLASDEVEFPRNTDEVKSEIKFHSGEKTTETVVRNSIIKMMSENTAVCMVRVADILKISKRTLSRRLQAEGCSFGLIYGELRDKKAKNLLLYTQLSIEEISSRCGYSSPASFSKAFRKDNSVSPFQYRKREKEEKQKLRQIQIL